MTDFQANTVAVPFPSWVEEIVPDDLLGARRIGGWNAIDHSDQSVTAVAEYEPGEVSDGTVVFAPMEHVIDVGDYRLHVDDAEHLAGLILRAVQIVKGTSVTEEGA